MGNRTHDLPACNIVPEPTTYRVPPVAEGGSLNIQVKIVSEIYPLPSLEQSPRKFVESLYLECTLRIDVGEVAALAR
jgi:hypothetical protein